MVSAIGFVFDSDFVSLIPPFFASIFFLIDDDTIMVNLVGVGEGDELCYITDSIHLGYCFFRLINITLGISSFCIIQVTLYMCKGFFIFGIQSSLLF